MRTKIYVLFAAGLGCGAQPSGPPRAAAPVAQSSPPAVPQAAPVASAVATSPVTPPTPAPSLPATFDVAAIDAYIAAQIPAQGFVGLSVAIVNNGAIVLEKGYGLSQLAPDAPVQRDTAFSIGSISKQFVSTLVLLLADEKKLSLQDPVAKYFPDLTRARDITLYDLMTHVSGYRDYFPLDFVDLEMKQPAVQDDVIARYGKMPLDFEPRTRFSYSSTGYKILGRVIEKVTGKPLGVVMSERIFRPAGMAHSSFEPEARAPGLASGYLAFALSAPRPAELEGRGWAFGGGGIFAPAGDVARWDLALMSGKVLQPKAYETLTTARRLADGRTTGYGCGIGTSVNRSGELVLRHSGESAGYVSYSVLLPRTKSAVVVLSNREDTAPWEIVNDIFALMTSEHRPPPPKIDGLSAKDAAKNFFAQMQSGRVDRARLGDDFNALLTDALLQEAAGRLRALGEPIEITVADMQERGGMEQSTVRLTFATTKLQARMFRSTDGKLQQFLLEKP